MSAGGWSWSVRLYLLCGHTANERLGIVPCLIQQDVWKSFEYPDPQKSPFKTPKVFCKEFLKRSISSISLNMFSPRYDFCGIVYRCYDLFLKVNIIS